jgi:hypothetical protein
MQQREFLERAQKALIKHGIIGSRAKALLENGTIISKARWKNS